MPHLPYKDIVQLIFSQWKNGITDQERDDFISLAEQLRKTYFKNFEEIKLQENQLRAEIHQLKYGGKNEAIKPTGKLRFLTAYRFFRKEEVPKVKAQNPHMEGRQRHALVK